MSQAGIVDIEASHPQIPTIFIANSGTAIPIANTLEILATTVAAYGIPLQTTGSGNTITVVGQYASASASTSAANAGLASFNSAYFTVDANGYVTLKGSAAIESFMVDASTPPGTNPVLPNGSGVVTITGGQVAAGTTTNVIQTNSLAANTYSIQIQRSQAVASTTIGDNGVSHFNSAYFSVDANGFVALTGLTNHAVLVGAGTAAITKVGPSATTGAVLASNGASSDPSFQTISSLGAITTITGNSGGAETPSSGNFNIVGTGSITVAGSANTETVQLTGLTNHALQVGAGTATLTQLGAGTTGQVLQTNTGADPTWSTATYPSTTTINQILYSSSANTVAGITAGANGVLISSASNVPSWLADGTTGQVLTATTGSPPSWVAPATSGTVTSVSVVSANGFAGTVATATTTPAITLTTTQTGLLSGNGTAITGTAITQYNVITGGASNAPNSVAPSSTSGVPLISQGSSAQPIFGTVAIAGGGTNATSMSTSTGIVKYDGTSLVTSTTAKIDSSNRMTNTSQPCFLVTANAQSNLTGDATVATVTFANTIFDNGSNFSSTTFTAPVTGRYLFCVNAMFTGIGAADSACLVRLTTTGGTYQGGGFNATAVKDASNILRTGFSVVVPMTAADTATVAIYAAGGTKAVGAGATDTNFSGHLVC